VEEFEQEFAKFCGTKYACVVCNGTAALHLALEALGVGEGDEVIVPSFTFVATVNAVTYTGATPVFVDSENDTWNINPELIKEKISPRTRAIIPVHIFGHPANMDPILEIADRHGLHVVEDAAEAHGAFYKNRKTGSMGKIGCFSLYGNKIITTGEGGITVTSDASLAERMAFLRGQAMAGRRRYYHPEIGYNYRLTNVQAAMGLAQLERINEFIDKKRKIAHWYNESLKDVKGITLPLEASWAKNVYWMYSILLNNEKERDELAKRLKRKGIDTRPFFYPVHLMPPYKSRLRLPVAERISKVGINLPSGVTLKKKDVIFVAESVKKTLKEIR